MAPGFTYNDALVCIKKSSYYRQVRRELDGPSPPKPSEFWVEEKFFYALFNLKYDRLLPLAPAILFVVSVETHALYLIRKIMPNAEATELVVEEVFVGGL